MGSLINTAESLNISSDTEERASQIREPHGKGFRWEQQHCVLGAEKTADLEISFLFLFENLNNFYSHLEYVVSFLSFKFQRFWNEYFFFN